MHTQNRTLLFGQNIQDRNGSVSGGGGLSTLIYIPKTTVVINNIKVMYNSGNVAISVTISACGHSLFPCFCVYTDTAIHPVSSKEVKYLLSLVGGEIETFL